MGSGKLPNWIHIHAWFICLLLWLRWSGLSLSAWQSHRRFISVSVGVGEEGMSRSEGIDTMEGGSRTTLREESVSGNGEHPDQPLLYSKESIFY